MKTRTIIIKGASTPDAIARAAAFSIEQPGKVNAGKFATYPASQARGQNHPASKIA